ncbi:MAG: DUF2314 domain-containing protein [Gammaproteobacteria bacterium]|nr:DUF2314 domain-containing protein [Gammaproteobacteria bacterium]NIR84587.1 DUF2314 domain-containing protein [Gammaproteobacteria bacterium]NIR90490.1 DUF2314 domain-containing protein [Gammaproteobacteria bacterium]NIU05638.1 DUF2314 domain-containing protein [Gammaproteobacteria bacterium]NIV52777.1 DUF2314 domain-containing protein [Gammaproteobacteria bacterium]
MSPFAVWLICITLVAFAIVLSWKGVNGLVQQEIPLTDEEMFQAATRARQTARDFIDASSNPAAGMEMFSVRVPVRYRDVVEHLWIDNPVYDGQSFVGTLSVDAIEVPGYCKGRKVKIDREHISDWMYVKDGRLVGGYTIRLHYSRQPNRVRKSLRDEFPFDLDTDAA